MRFLVPAIVVLVVVACLAALVSVLGARPPAVVQPIAFDHALHIEDAALECLDCHTDAGTSVFAGLPGKEICLDCHDTDEDAEEGSELAKLLAFAGIEENIPWIRVAVTRPDVFFSHRRHVTAGGIDCLDCHADEPALTAPPVSVRLVMTMTECKDCHLQSGVSTDCLACHR